MTNNSNQNQENVNQGNENAEEMKIVYFGGQRIPVLRRLTIEEIKAGLSEFFPRIADATPFEDDEGNVRFMVEAGEKGSDESENLEDMKFVFFGGQKIPVPRHLSVEEIKAGLSEFIPRIADATPVEENGNIRFMVEAGEKGSIYL